MGVPRLTILAQVEGLHPHLPPGQGLLRDWVGLGVSGTGPRGSFESTFPAPEDPATAGMCPMPLGSSGWTRGGRGQGLAQGRESTCVQAALPGIPTQGVRAWSPLPYAPSRHSRATAHLPGDLGPYPFASCDQDGGGLHVQAR